MGQVKELSDHDFETEVLKSTEPVLVDFGSLVRSVPDDRTCRRGTGYRERRGH